MAKKTITIKEDLRPAVGGAFVVLDAGGIVVFPTETVYGVGIAADHPEAMEKLRTMKKRPADKPFQLLVADVEMARKVGAVFTRHSLNLANAFWPGPLTLVVPDGTGSGSIGVRVPDSPFVIELCRKLGRPIISSSANVSGQRPPLDAETAAAFGDDVDLLIDAGPIVEGTPSTVVECREDGFTILRQGEISMEAVASAWMA